MLFAAIVTMLSVSPVADACTRAVYFGKNSQTVTGRTMDWFSDMQSNLWLFPRGMKRTSVEGPNPVMWTSKHGTVITSIYEGGVADGMNEKGLVGNMLYLAESVYPPESPSDQRPTLNIAEWTQYVLDNYATVAEAVEALKQDAVRMVAISAPTGEKGTVHLAISDPSGDSAILEYIDGNLIIHHGRQYQVMTNSPTFDKQLPLNEYWKQIGGTVMLPGTNRASDRFARASFYINAAQQSEKPREAVAAVFSVMRNVSVPRGISTPDQPNISTTIWRTVSDQKTLVYYYESTFSPSVVWVRFADLDFKAGTGVRKIQLDGHPEIAGDQTASFQPAEPFTFLGSKQ